MRHLTDNQRDLLVKIHNARTMTYDALTRHASIDMSSGDFNAIVSHLNLIPEQSYSQVYVYRLTPEVETSLRQRGYIK